MTDTREQKAFWPDGKRATLRTGDYSVAGLADVVAVERKSGQDLLGSMGGNKSIRRQRLLREFRRLSLMRFGAFVVECPAPGLYTLPAWGRITPSHAIGSLISWQQEYRVTVYWAESVADARQWTRTWLRQAWERASGLKAGRHDRPECPCGGGEFLAHDGRWKHEES